MSYLYNTPIEHLETLTISADDLAQGFVKLQAVARPGSVKVITSMVSLAEGEDFTITNYEGQTRIVWTGDLVGISAFELGDVLHVHYLT